MQALQNLGLAIISMVAGMIVDDKVQKLTTTIITCFWIEFLRRSQSACKFLNCPEYN